MFLSAKRLVQPFYWFIVLTGCQSVGDKAEKANLSVGAIASSACKVEAGRCKNHGIAMVCTADRYDRAVLPDWKLLKGWGGSVCAAEQDLWQRACEQGLQRNKIGEISCAPDPSEGECAELVENCEPDDDQAYCFASTYDETKLRPDQMVAGRGKGECRARFSMKLQACLLNLKPSLMDDIACLKDTAAANCPVEAKSCVGDYFPFICEGKLVGGILRSPFEAKVFAENSCLAEVKLQQIACNLNISPDAIKDSRCFADR